MKKLMTSFTRSNSIRTRARSSTREERLPPPPSPDDPPETAIIKAIVHFCASGGPSSTTGSEVLYLPTIVDSAESSPTAAKDAAAAIRKQLDIKHNTTHPYKQYNAIMLLRILSDNPGRTFTRNLSEPKFVGAVKTLLRQGRDPSVRQILGETLEYWEVSKGDDEGLVSLKEVWIKEKKNMNLSVAGPGGPEGSRGASPSITHAPGSHSRTNAHGTQSNGLPPMVELTARISEARTSASLLEQVLQSTPPAEVPKSELVKEFADRCQSATRSIVSYIQATDPSPDEDTITTLIETNDFLGMALERYKNLVAATQEKEQAERASQVPGGARIVNVGDAWDVAYTGAHVGSGGRGDAGGIQGGGHGVHGVHGAPGVGEQQVVVRRRSEEMPDSPVSPVSPSHPISYRY